MHQTRELLVASRRRHESRQDNFRGYDLRKVVGDRLLVVPVEHGCQKAHLVAEVVDQGGVIDSGLARDPSQTCAVESLLGEGLRRSLNEQ